MGFYENVILAQNYKKVQLRNWIITLLHNVAKKVNEN